jgi:AcrR family transcriptional regulator
MTSVIGQDKKQLIITAVQELLAEKGYTATTINEIAHKAKISRGLMHYYFKSKEEMIVEALRAAMQTSISQGRELFVQAKDAKILAAGITMLLKRLVLEYPGFFRLLFEGWSASLQSSIIKDEVGFLYQQFIDIIKDGLDFLKNRGIIAAGIDTVQTALLLTGLFDGLGMLALNRHKQVNTRQFWEKVEKTMHMILL